MLLKSFYCFSSRRVAKLTNIIKARMIPAQSTDLKQKREARRLQILRRDPINNLFRNFVASTAKWFTHDECFSFKRLTWKNYLKNTRNLKSFKSFWLKKPAIVRVAKFERVNNQSGWLVNASKQLLLRSVEFDTYTVFQCTFQQQKGGGTLCANTLQKYHRDRRMKQR